MRTATFLSNARIVGQDGFKESFANLSVSSLENVIPEPSYGSPDLLYLASDLFVAGVMNKNGHAISIEDSIDLAPTFINKFIDIEHDRSRVLGNILKYSFTEYGNSNEIQDISSWVKDGKLFNISYGGYVWKILYPNLTDILINSSDPKSEYFESVSSSWEVGFDEYDIAVGSPIVSEAEIITDPKKKELFKKFLKGNGGEGKRNGENVYMVLRGKMLGLGVGLVANPAADVKGVKVLLDDIKININSQKKEKKAKTSVIKIKPMKTLQDLYNKIAESEGAEVAASAQDVIRNAIKEADEAWAAKQAEWTQENESIKTSHAELEDKLNELKLMKAQLESSNASMTETVETLKTSLSETNEKLSAASQRLKELQDAEDARLADERFQSRMASVDTEYNLTDDDRKVVAAQAKVLDDESYANWIDNVFAILASAKKKSKNAEEIDGEKDESCAANLEQEVNEILASVDPEKEIPNHESQELSLSQRMKAVFGEDSFEIVKK